MSAAPILHCRRSALVTLALAVLTLSGCAANRAQSEHAAAAPLPGTDACVFISSISDWQVIDPSTMIVYAPLPKDAYLLKLFAPISDLNFKERVGFEDSDHNGQVCGNGDYLVVRDAVSPRRMPIVAFRKLTPQQAQQLLPKRNAPPAKSGSSQPSSGNN